MQVFTRGDLLEFAVVFMSDSNQNIQPASVQLNITFPVANTRERRVYPLSKGIDNKWRYIWDSSEAPIAGRVNYSLKATGPLKDVEDGSIMLTANDANLD